MTCFRYCSTKDGPYGGCDNIAIHLGVISPKTPPKGARIGNFKPNGQNIKKNHDIIIFLTLGIYSRGGLKIDENKLKGYDVAVGDQ